MTGCGDSCRGRRLGVRDQFPEVVVDEHVSGGDPLVPYVAGIRREYGAQRQFLRPAQVGAASPCSTELFPTNSGYAVSRRALQVIDLKSRNNRVSTKPFLNCSREMQTILAAPPLGNSEE